MQVMVTVSPEATQGQELEDDSRKDGEVVVLEVEFLEASAEGESVWEAAEVVAVEGERLELVEMSNGGREIAETSVVQVEVSEVR